jgi:hypothetical protein
MPAPAHPKIYHIAHIDRLGSILASGGLLSDARLAGRAAGTTIGMGDLKARRLQRPVPVCPGTCVGDFVPFYFCSRSVMLYVIHQANHPNLAYRGGAGPIIHLEADLRVAVDWAVANGQAWALALGNASANYTEFRDNLAGLDEINWAAVSARDFREPAIKDAKQAEFLLHGFFPWELVERIGVRDRAMFQAVADALQHAHHHPRIEIKRDWYF